MPGEGGLDVEGMLSSAETGGLDLVFLLGADEFDTRRLGEAFVVYVGTHGDVGAHRADVILPGAAYPEKPGTWVNTEGRVQRANRAGFPPGEAREDWAILRALSPHLGHQLGYDSLPELRAAMFERHPHLALDETVMPADVADLTALAGLGGAVEAGPFVSPVRDFYLTNPIARASAVMAECSAIARDRLGAEAAE